MVWASAFALIFHGITRYRPGTIVIWIGVVSHWVLDWISHRPEMPLYPGGQRVGLGLWNSIPGTKVVEIGMLAAGVYLYARATRARDPSGRYLLAAFVGLLLVLYIADRFSPPPPNVAAIACTGIAAVIIFLSWSWWLDRRRTPLV